MSTSDPNQNQSLGDIAVDKRNLYREEVFTDLKVATIRRLVPVNLDGTTDSGRAVIYTGETQVYTGSGVLPVSARIEADSIEAALDAFPSAIEAAMEDMIEEAREMQRQQSSRLVIPGGPPPPSGGGRLRL